MRPLKPDSPAQYQIRIQGALAAEWHWRLEGMAVNSTRLPDGTDMTILTGDLADQTALLGILNTLYDLHCPLLSVTCLSKDGRGAGNRVRAGDNDA